MEKCTFYFNVMPFGLKNARATYQRMVSKVFKGLIGKILKAYIDDTVVKRQDFYDHMLNLRLVFERLQKYRVKLNPKNCMFAIRSKMFLGHVVDKKGIEAFPMQVQDIFKLPELRTKKEIQMLIGRVSTLSRFISRMIDRCKPFFSTLVFKG